MCHFVNGLMILFWFRGSGSSIVYCATRYVFHSRSNTVQHCLVFGVVTVLYTPTIITFVSNTICIVMSRFNDILSIRWDYVCLRRILIQFFVFPTLPLETLGYLIVLY
jgi:hypothetical protein